MPRTLSNRKTGKRHSPLPAEVYAEEVVEPPVVRLEVLFQPAPGRRVHLLLIAASVALDAVVLVFVTLTAGLCGFGSPVGQIEEIFDQREGLLRVPEEV